MRSQDMSGEEIVRLGMEVYDQRLKPILEPQQNGRFVAIAVEDGDYEVADTSVEAGLALRERHPAAVFYEARVGFPYSGIFTTPYYETPRRGDLPRELAPSGDPLADEAVRKGLEIYDRKLKPLLEPRETGRYVVVNVDNEDFVVADTSTEAGTIMRARYPDQVFYTARIGYDLISTSPGPQVSNAPGNR
jgi:hypothetical protein